MWQARRTVITNCKWREPAEALRWFFRESMQFGMIAGSASSNARLVATLGPATMAEIRDHSPLPQHRW